MYTLTITVIDDKPEMKIGPGDCDVTPAQISKVFQVLNQSLIEAAMNNVKIDTRPKEAQSE